MKADLDRETGERAMTDERRMLLNFLRGHLPVSDLDCYPEALFARFVDHALFLRKSVPWCAALDQEIFEHYVLFPRVNDEDLSFHRKLFYDALWPRIQGLPTAEARVLEVNRWCHEIASYQAQDDRTASPLTVYRSGSGRCGEESAFLVSALRSVGIPARQVYVPRWAHCDDNHAWVEALCDGRWRFLGACEPEPILDKGWFDTAASRAVLVHSRLFGAGHSPLHGELLGREGAVCWYNQTRRYARTQTYTFRALWGSAPAAGAIFQIQLLNEASFHTIAILTADDQGRARAELGVGDIHVLASWKGMQAEGDCSEGGVTLHLAPPADQDTGWMQWDAHAPKAETIGPAPLDAAQRAVRAAVLQEGTELREKRLASFYQQTGKGPWEEVLRSARGNCQTIAAFLGRDDDPRREQLVRALSDKDLRDVTLEILEDHLQNAPPDGSLPADLYASYVLCPRIELEPLTLWRGALRTALTGEETPLELWRDLNDRIDTKVARTYPALVWMPWESWRAGRCDRRSLRILYVACLRTLGIPARLRQLDGAPEYWHDGGFHPVQPEQTGILHLTGDPACLYRQNWTLSRREEEGWQLMTLPGKARDVMLPVGRYRIVTSARLPNGDQFAAMRELSIRPGAVQDAELSLRTYGLRDMLGRQPLPAMPARTLEGTAVPNLCRMGSCGSLLCWIEPGSEPTEHLLNELAAGQEALEALPLEIVLLLRGQESLDHPTLAEVLAQWTGIRALVDDWAYDQESVARQLGCDPSETPLAVVCNEEGQAVYAASGYRVGSVELLTRIAAYICDTSKKRCDNNG